MIQVTPHMKILLAVEPVDFRAGIDGLGHLCQDVLRSDPRDGTLFAFRNKRGSSVKLLVFDGQGTWLFLKRLSSGTFRWWPKHGQDGALRLDAHALQLLLWNGDPTQGRVPPAWRPLLVDPRPQP